MDDPDRLVTDATRWLADARIDEAARARSRERWLRQQAEEGATFAGVLLALGERGADVELALADGSSIGGAISAVGADYVQVTEADGSRTFVALRSLAGVWDPAAGTPTASDERRGHSERLLWQVLAEAVAERPGVTVRAGRWEVEGDLVGAGADVVTVARSRPEVFYLPVGSVSVVSFRSSG